MELFKDKVAWFSTDVAGSIAKSWESHGGTIQKSLSKKNKEGITHYFAGKADDPAVKSIMDGGDGKPVLVFAPTYITDTIRDGRLINPGSYILPPPSLMTMGIELAAPVTAESNKKFHSTQENEDEDQQIARLREGYEKFENGDECDPKNIEVIRADENGWIVMPAAEMEEEEALKKKKIARQRSGRRGRHHRRGEPEHTETEEIHADKGKGNAPERNEDVIDAAPVPDSDVNVTVIVPETQDEDVEMEEIEGEGESPSTESAQKELENAVYCLGGDVGLASSYVQGQITLDDLRDRWWTKEMDAVVIGIVKGEKKKSDKISKAKLQKIIQRISEKTGMNKLKCRARIDWLDLMK